MEIKDICQSVSIEILAAHNSDEFYLLTHGWCDEWAHALISRLDFRSGKIIWLDDEYPMCFHCVVLFNGKYYDAECPEGVESIEEIPFVTEFFESNCVEV